MPYPPGTSASDPRAPWNEPDHSHEHEWRLLDDGPIIEDGAAIFQEECRYVEGQYGEGWECEETRSYRFEYAFLRTPEGLEVELPDITEWDTLSSYFQDRVVQVEERHCYVGPADGETTIEVDPDPEYGSVTITWNGWDLQYEP